MKRNARKILLSFLVAVAGLMNFQVLMANELGGPKIIDDINLSKKIIKFSGQSFKFNKNTKVYDSKGNRIEMTILQRNMLVVPVYDVGSRYVGYPTVQKIYLKSVIY